MTQSTRDDLTDRLRRIEARMSEELDMLDEVYEADPEEFIEQHRDILEDLDLSTDPDDWYVSAIEERVRESFEDVLSIDYERGEPFSVTLAWGGPNIYLVDLGGFGGTRLVGFWGYEEVIRTGSGVDRLIDYFREYASEVY